MKLAEFFIDLVVNAAGGEMTVKNLVSSFGDLEVAGAAELMILDKLAVAFVDLTSKAVDAAIGFQMFETQSGRSSTTLQRWQLMAEQANVSADAVKNSVLALERGMAEISLGRGNTGPFQMLGIDPRGKDAFRILNELRSALRSVPNQAMKVNLLQQMGIDPSMLQLLELTNQQLAEFAQTSSGMTQNQERQFLKLHLVVVQLAQVFRQMGYAIVSFFAPAMEGALSDVLAMVNSLKKGFEDYPSSLKLMIASVALLAAAFMPVTAAVVGLLLLMDDLAAYFQGKNSMIGWLEKQGKETLGAVGAKIADNPIAQSILHPQLVPALANNAAWQNTIQAPMSNVFNISGVTHSAEDLARMIAKVLHKEFDATYATQNNQGKK